MKRLTILGLALTTLWVLAFGSIVASKYNSAIAMNLNEWGDFLAGFSAPMALLWLVIGYFQHGQELRLNTRALETQQEELRRQVEETAYLARNAERQAAASEMLAQLSKSQQERAATKEAIEAQPVFFAHGGSSGGAMGEITTNLTNRGGEARDLALEYEGPHSLQFSPLRLWEAGKQGSLQLRPGGAQLQFPIGFSMIYTDRFGNRHRVNLELIGNHDLRELETQNLDASVTPKSQEPS